MFHRKRVVDVSVSKEDNSITITTENFTDTKIISRIINTEFVGPDINTHARCRKVCKTILDINQYEYNEPFNFDILKYIYQGEIGMFESNDEGHIIGTFPEAENIGEHGYKDKEVNLVLLRNGQRQKIKDNFPDYLGGEYTRYLGKFHSILENEERDEYYLMTTVNPFNKIRGVFKINRSQADSLRGFAQ